MTYFDERARDWDSDPGKVERARVVANAIRLRLPRSHNLTGLEVGCGTGLLSFALQPDFKAITLADTSQGMLTVLSEKIQAAGVTNMHPLMIDLAKDPLPETSFDVIFSMMTLHHISETDRLLGQLFSLTNPGGLLCMVDLEKEDGSFHGKAVTDVHLGFEQSVLKQQLEAAGFSNPEFSRVFEMKKLVAGLEKVFPLFLAVAHKA